VLDTSPAHCVPVSVLLLSMAVLWEPLKGGQIGRYNQARRCTEGNVLGPQPVGFALLSGEDHRCKTELNTKKKCVTAFSEQGLQMFYSLRKRAFVSFPFFVGAHTGLCLWYQEFWTCHPSFSPFAVRGSGIKPYCCYSISCHYRRQFDY